MFITFRTADLLPKEVILRWQRELERWLAMRYCFTRVTNTIWTALSSCPITCMPSFNF